MPLLGTAIPWREYAVVNFSELQQGCRLLEPVRPHAGLAASRVKIVMRVYLSGRQGKLQAKWMAVRVLSESRL